MMLQVQGKHLAWVGLLPDYQVQVMDSQQPLYHKHRATIDEPWRWRGFVYVCVCWGVGTYRCALWIALLLSCF